MYLFSLVNYLLRYFPNWYRVILARFAEELVQSCFLISKLLIPTTFWLKKFCHWQICSVKTFKKRNQHWMGRGAKRLEAKVIYTEGSFKFVLSVWKSSG